MKISRERIEEIRGHQNAFADWGYPPHLVCNGDRADLLTALDEREAMLSLLLRRFHPEHDPANGRLENCGDCYLRWEAEQFLAATKWETK